MPLLLSYFSTRRMALMPPLFLAVFALVFLLYGLPLYAVGYACALCAPVYIAALAVSLARFARRHRTLHTLLTCADLCSAHLPAPRDALEADLQDVHADRDGLTVAMKDGTVFILTLTG